MKIIQKADSIKTQIIGYVVIFVLSSAMASWELDFSRKMWESREWNAQNSCHFWTIPTAPISSSFRLWEQQSAAQKLQRFNWHLTKHKQGGDHRLLRHRSPSCCRMEALTRIRDFWEQQLFLTAAGSACLLAFAGTGPNFGLPEWGSEIKSL